MYCPCFYYISFRLNDRLIYDQLPYLVFNAVSISCFYTNVCEELLSQMGDLSYGEVWFAVGFVLCGRAVLGGFVLGYFCLVSCRPLSHFYTVHKPHAYFLRMHTHVYASLLREIMYAHTHVYVHWSCVFSCTYTGHVRVFRPVTFASKFIIKILAWCRNGFAAKLLKL